MTKHKKFRAVFEYEVEYTDFPDDELKLWVKDQIQNQNQVGWDSSGIEDCGIINCTISEIPSKEN